MNKSGLIDFVAQTTGLTKEKASDAVNAVFQGVRQGVVADGALTIIGHGTYSREKRAARQAYNPSKGSMMTIPETMVFKFKPGKELKEAVKEVETVEN